MDLTGALWRTSTGSGNSECVEVASNLPGAVGVRENRGATGPVLVFAPAAWRPFVTVARRPSV
ncbi:DUF397 domain-containing protein [Micromonospora vinacea]|uniref:DUF397 domain-containing protein n=1 Tax=Micromonospora vinacea TaxID=709878 RepID=UPI003D8B2E22